MSDFCCNTIQTSFSYCKTPRTRTDRRISFQRDSIREALLALREHQNISRGRCMSGVFCNMLSHRLLSLGLPSLPFLQYRNIAENAFNVYNLNLEYSTRPLTHIITDQHWHEQCHLHYLPCHWLLLFSTRSCLRFCNNTILAWRMKL